MMANVDKCHLLLSADEDHTIENFYFDDELKFDFYFEELCKNANRKLRALPRVTPSPVKETNLNECIL